MKKLLALFLVLMFALALFTGCAQEEEDSEDSEDSTDAVDVEELEITFSSTFSETETGGQIIAYFAEYLSEISDGAITVSVTYSSTLYSSADELDAVSDGAVDMIALGHNPHSDLLPLLCSMPDFAPDSIQNALDYFNYVLFEDEESSALLEAEATSNNVKYLNVIAGGANAFVASVEFTDLASLIEASTSFGNMEASKFEYLGFTVVEMLPTEMYDSFDTGLVDASQMAFSSMVSVSIQEVATYWMLDNTYTAGNFFTVNLDWWDALSEDQQELIQKAADAAEDYSVELYTTAIDTDMQTIEDAGCTIIEMTDEDFDTWWDAIFVSKIESADGDENAMIILQAAADFTGYEITE